LARAFWTRCRGRSSATGENPTAAMTPREIATYVWLAAHCGFPRRFELDALRPPNPGGTDRCRSCVSRSTPSISIRASSLENLPRRHPTSLGGWSPIQESEHQIVTAYEVLGHDRTTSPCGPRRWIGIKSIVGRDPDLAAGDRGFNSATNEETATIRGVRRIVVPRRGRKSPARRSYERQPWFRRGQRWRVGSEG
jgi:hypothetical protein